MVVVHDDDDDDDDDDDGNNFYGNDGRIREGSRSNSSRSIVFCKMSVIREQYSLSCWSSII